MAINMSNKKALIGQILPEIEFNITANGLTISASERISSPRFVPFDHAGRCRECKGSEVELDFVVTKEGVTCYCTRIKTPTFIPFDTIHDLPGHCFFKIKNKGRIFNIEHGSPPCAATPIIKNIQPEIKEVEVSPIKPPSPKKIKQEIPADEEFENILQEFFDNIGCTTTTSATTTATVPIEKEKSEEKITKEQEKEVIESPPHIENLDNIPLP
uniref:Uncharacterized protein n=1 Tax=Meloidogyne enterolobii TaxID=390850 RepID=A0A6V7XXT4_MELEN|nr:unnamed protein product [Meloidogyne enterolobii]